MSEAVFPAEWDEGESKRLAELLIQRLNDLIASDPCMGKVMQQVMQKLVIVEDPIGAVLHHPTIQVFGPGEREEVAPSTAGVTLLGLLNGMVGVIPRGPKEGFGYIAAMADGKDQPFVRFDLTESLHAEQLKKDAET